MKIYASAILIGAIIGGYFFVPNMRERFDNTVKEETAPLAKRIEALEEANVGKAVERRQAFDTCIETLRPNRPDGMTQDDVSFCIKTSEEVATPKNHHFYPASGE